MRFSERWLRSWVDPPASTEELAKALTMAGLEVDAVEPVAAAIQGVVVGEIKACDPITERLSLCRIDVGGTSLEIVTASRGVAPGLKVAAASPGARVGGRVIEAKAFKGVVSQGMLCAGEDLGLEERSEDILILPPDAPVGEDIRRYLELDDFAITLELTPNRGDCLSIQGIAREVGAIFRASLSPPPREGVPIGLRETLGVQVEAPDRCPRYVGRVIRGLDPCAETPLWMRERLRRSGLRSLGPLVDVTNYVMLELGQPMHAFDLSRLEGGIVVRLARPGESLLLLDGREVALEGDMLIIADARGPVALAGIMGGQTSAVGEGTRDIFLESAFFSPEAIAGRARRLGLHTDASHRFERGVDPALTLEAMERASALLVDIAGGRAGPPVEVRDEAHLPHPSPIPLRRKGIRRLLGMDIPEAPEILTHLSMEVEEEEEGWRVIPPTFRFDIALEADLVEEVARLHGYHRLPSSLPRAPLEMLPSPEGTVMTERLKVCLNDRGYTEAITYSFVDPRWQSLLDPQHPPRALQNPLSGEMAVMRTSLLPGLLKALLHNQRRQQPRVRFFEVGAVFLDKEEARVGGVASGGAYPEQWGMEKRHVDFFDIKGDLEALLALTHDPGAFSFVRGHHPALHPGKCASIERGGEVMGWIGALHPQVAAELDLQGEVYAFELSLDTLTSARLPHFRPFSRYPAIRRDIAFLVDREVPVASILEAVRDAAGDSLAEVVLFDVYAGRGVPQGKKSLALGLILQHISRTLTERDVEQVVEEVMMRLQSRFGAVLRGSDDPH